MHDEKGKESKKTLNSAISELRQKAEEVILKQTHLSKKNLKVPNLEELEEIILNLNVHQVELEMQNEQLAHSQQELESLKERYFNLYELAPVAYFTLDEQNKIKECNLTSEKLLGFTKSALKEELLSKFISRSYQDTYYFYIKKLRELKNSVSCELPMIKQDGSLFWGRLEGVMTIDHDNNSIIRIIICDVTKSEELLLQKNSEIKDSHDELESFNSTVSHDLRSPLQTVGSYIQIIFKNHSQGLSPEVNEMFNRIYLATKRMGAILDGLVLLSKISRTEMKLEDVNLSLIVKDIANELKLRLPENNLKLIIKNDLIVFGDNGLLTILVCNLLNNAFKFSSKKKEIIIEFGCLENEENLTKTPLTYFLRDNGAGFDMRHSDKLFKPFERLHANNEFPGTGVGLASVQRIIQLHSGNIWAEGVPDVGSTFYFTLPKIKSNPN